VRSDHQTSAKYLEDLATVGEIALDVSSEPLPASNEERRQAQRSESFVGHDEA
jgi:hypothetical protein